MDAFFVRAHPKGVTDVGEHQSIAPPESREALTTAALSLVCSFRVARPSPFSGIAPARSFAALRMTTATVILRRYLGSNEEGQWHALQQRTKCSDDTDSSPPRHCQPCFLPWRRRAN